MSTDQSQFFKHLFVPVYLPAILFATGEGALIPVVPLTAHSLGANLAMASIIAGLLMIGIVAGDVPAGMLVARFGEETAMRVSATLAAIASIVCWMTNSLILLAVGVFLIGMASATFALARQTFLTQWTPTAFRARAMSLLGGTTRVGYFIGPFIAAPIIGIWGSRSVYWAHVVACAAVIVALWIMPNPREALERNRARATAQGLTGPIAVIRSTDVAASDAVASSAAQTHAAKPRPALIAYISQLIRLGTAAGIIQMLRASRQVILPLWGVHLQLPETHIAVIVGFAGAVDLALFYTSGQIMDRYGRRWAAVPVLIGLSVSHFLLMFAGSEWSYIAIAVLMSLSNGLGSGIVMTLGSDMAARYAPERMPAYLGAWRVFSDTGSALGPILISTMTAAVSLAGAAGVMAGAGLLGAVLMYRYIPRLVGK